MTKSNLFSRLFRKGSGQKRSGGERVVIWIVFAIFLVYAVTLVFPFLWMLFNSVRDSVEFTQNPWGMPTKYQFSNYIDVLFLKAGGSNLLGMFGTSILLTVGGTFLNVLFSSLAAYAVSKYRFRGRNLLYSLAIFIMIVPIVGTLPSQYQVMRFLHLHTSIVGVLILYSGAFGFNFFLLYGFFQNLSWSYAEAAFVDGATDAKVLFRIMLPLAKPAIIAVGIIHAIGLWNDYQTPSIYMKNMPALAVGLNQLLSELSGKYPKMFATMIIAMLPVLAVFICFQKTIMENTIAGGLKG